MTTGARRHYRDAYRAFPDASLPILSLRMTRCRMCLAFIGTLAVCPYCGDNPTGSNPDLARQIAEMEWSDRGTLFIAREIILLPIRLLLSYWRIKLWRMVKREYPKFRPY